MERDIYSEYYWKKNSGPPVEKNKQKNHLIDYALAYMKKYGSIIKTYHLVDTSSAWNEEEQLRNENKILNKDLVPFVVYSKNKKERWLTEENITQKMIAELQELNNGIEVVLLERIFLGMDPVILGIVSWLPSSKIGAVHRLKDVDNDKLEYCEKRIRGKGNIYSSIVDKKEKKKRTMNEGQADVTVSYSFLTPPTSFKKILHNDWCSNSWTHDGPDFGYWERKERLRMEYIDIRYGDLNFYDFDETHDDIDDEYERVYNDEKMTEEMKKPSKYYDLIHHFVEKFVFVKQINKNMK